MTKKAGADNAPAFVLDNGEPGPRRWVGDMPAPMPLHTSRPPIGRRVQREFMLILHYQRTHVVMGTTKTETGKIGPLPLTLLLAKYSGKMAIEINQGSRILDGKQHGDRVKLSDIVGFKPTDVTRYRLEKHDPRPIEQEI